MAYVRDGDRRREAGAAMFMAVLLLVLMGAMGLAAVDMAGRDRQAAGFQNRSLGAFYAAEAGAAHGRALIRGVGDRSETPALPTTNLGDLGAGNLYDRESQLPQYYPDPAFADPVRYADKEGAIAGGMNLQEGGTKFVNTLWQINVVGQSANALDTAFEGRASTARIEVMETKVLASGY